MEKTESGELHNIKGADEFEAMRQCTRAAARVTPLPSIPSE